MPYNLNIEGHFFISCMKNRPASLARRGCFILPERACGEGCFEGNFVPLESHGGSGNLGRGSQAFCYFLCAKSKEGIFGFADAVPHGRVEGLHNRSMAQLGAI